MTLRQRPNRQPLAIPVPPDQLEQLHPRSHPFRRLPLEPDEHRTVGNRSDGDGASSSVHTGASSKVRAQQTRFVLRKALESRLPVILVINKIDRRGGRIPDDNPLRLESRAA